MAQLQEKSRRTLSHVARRLRGNPALVGALAAVALALAAVCALGIAQAPAAQELVFEASGDSAGEGTDGSGGAEDAGGDRGGSASTGPDDEDGDAGDGAGAQKEPSTVVVDVDGAVVSPGVYELDPDARVNDALAAAGGLAADADASGLNRAAPLSDGEKIYVPRQGEEPPQQAAPADTAQAGAATGSEAGALININTATLEELDALPGVGPATAQAIIDDRTQNGAFSTVEDIMRVSGIGEKKFEKMKSAICV